jgi:orotidine-5'-phosphate decarboxylase
MRAELQAGVSRILVCGRRGEVILPLRNIWIVAGDPHSPSERGLHGNLVSQGNGHNESLDVVKPVSTPAMNPQLQIDFGRRTQLHGARHPAQMTCPAKEKIIVALDTPDSISALRLVDDLKDAISWVKVGLQLFTAQGPAIVTALKERRLKVFLDLKFHDIPNTAHEAMRSAVRLGADMATIHLSGGSRMVRSAIEATAGSPLLVLGVTVLTSFDEAELRGIGVQRTPEEQVAELAALGCQCGLRGVVCSPREITSLRSKFGDSLKIVTPGVRPAGSAADDQQRVMTPAEAVRAGASHLVIGRPITAARSPREATLRIAEEIASSLRT